MEKPLGRRELLKLAGVGLLGTAASRAFDSVGIPAARAQDVLTGKTGVLQNKLFVGNVEVLALTDHAGDFPMPLSQLFPNVPADAWAPFRQRYPELFNGPDTWRNHYGCYLLRSQGRTILVDTGLGSKATNPRAIDKFGGGIDGRLLAELQAAGVRPEEVDTVFFTHLHIDHVGWNLSQGGANPRPMFPRARYVVHQTDWASFKQAEVHDPTSFPSWEETLGPLEMLGVLDLLPGERALTSEITAVPTPGHTPGHMSLAIVSGGQRALIMGDVAVHPAQITETDWSMRLDMDQELAARVRRRVLDRVEAENTTLVACHFPEPGFGHLVRVEGRRYWQSVKSEINTNRRSILMLSEQIIGVWELQSWETVVDDKVIGYPLGEKASGFLVYHPVGFMAVNISAPNRVRIPTDSPFEGDPKLLALDAKGYLSYCGPFSIVSENEVIHHVKLCSFENWVGADQRRNAHLIENTLTLSTAPRLLLGKNGIGRLTWKRVTTFK